MSVRSVFRTLGPALAATAFLATSGVAEPAPELTQAQKETLRAEMKAEKKAKDAYQRQGYLRSVPAASADIGLEGDMIKMRALRNWDLLTYPTGTLPSAPWARAAQHVDQFVRDAAPWPGAPIQIGSRFAWQKANVNPNENTWTAVGPTPLDSVGTTNNAFTYGTVAGRVGAGALAVDPNDTNVAYAGFVAGGLWKTTNLQATSPSWTPLIDDRLDLVQSIGAITIDPNDSNTIYAGTGDWPATDQFSYGILKSTDGGATWNLLAEDVFAPFASALPAGGNRWSNQNTKVIAVDPKNSNTVLVGTRYDLYLSNDGGSTWSICGFGNGYTDPNPNVGSVNALNRVSGIVLDDRGATTTAYVSVGYQFENGNGNNGVYRFDIPASGCPSWPADIELLNAGFPANTGNGVNNENGGSVTGRIEIAGSTSSGSLTLYALVADAFNYDFEGLWVLRPDGGSTTWSQVSVSTSGCSSLSTGQDWYDLFLGVDPADDKRLFIGHIDVFRGDVNSSYTSMTQTNLTDVYGTNCANYGAVHPDQHAFAWVGSTGEFLVGNDGGVYYNTNGAASGFRQINDSFNTNQFYAGQIGANFANGGNGNGQWLFGGMQDNGNASWDSSASDFEWTARSVGGDGFFTTFDPLNGDLSNGIWMTEYTYGSLYVSSTGADGPFSAGGGGGPFGGGCEPSYQGSPDWSTPFQLDTLNCDADSCDNYLLGEDYVWAATSFRRSCPQWTRISGLMIKSSADPRASILTLAAAPSEPKAAVVGTSDGKVWWTETAYSGSGCTAAAANTSSFACSANSGATWVDADGSNSVLPNRAILQVAFDPTDHDTAYAAVGGFDENTPGTPGHLFQLNQSGGSISVVDKSGNLPNVPASAVAVNPHNRKQVYVGTHFGFFYTDDIDAATPVWTRYNDGMPNTIIQYLTIDRGPQSDPLKGTTLAAFTYGRGIYLLKLPTGGTGGNNPPTAAFTESCVDLACTFTDLSSDSDGSVVAWSWDFGGDGSSAAQSPSHTFSAAGTYSVSLTVTDNEGAQNTTSASVTVSTTGGNVAPTADFSESCTDLACTFTDLSSDSDGSVVAWSWDFGGDGSSAAQSPSHTFSAAGTYSVSLTVTDDGGAQDTTSRSVTVTAPSTGITLSANGYKVKGVKTIDLTWSGATSTNVDVYRDGTLITTTANDGAYTDSTGQKGGGSYTHQICEAGTSTCSNVTTTVF